MPRFSTFFFCIYIYFALLPACLAVWAWRGDKPIEVSAAEEGAAWRHAPELQQFSSVDKVHNFCGLSRYKLSGSCWAAPTGLWGP